MDHSLEVRNSVQINADRTQVWHALTTPAVIKKWLYDTDTETTWKPGDPIVFTGSWEGNAYRDHGIIKEYKEFERIAYSYWSGFSGLPDAPENHSMVIYELSGDDPATTTFTWIQKGFANEDSWKHSKDGMADFLKIFKGVAESTQHH